MNDVYVFFNGMRRSGTTSLLQKIAAENDVWVLVPTEVEKREFGGKAITFHEIGKLGGETAKKPILVDNYTLLNLSGEASREFTTLETMIARRDKLIKTIRDEITSFDRNNPRGENYLDLLKDSMMGKSKTDVTWH